jgi:hypothetical protein
MGIPSPLPAADAEGLSMHPDMECIPSSVSTTAVFDLVVPGEFIKDYRHYVATKITPNRAIPKAARELLWCLGESTARKITRNTQRFSQGEYDDDPDGSNEKLSPEQIDSEFNEGPFEAVIVHNDLGGIYALKSIWTKRELEIAGPYLPPYVTLNGHRINWETRAKQLQSQALAGTPDILTDHLASLVVDEEYRGYTELRGNPDDPQTPPIEVEMPEQVGIHPEFALQARLEATHFQSMDVSAETNNPPRHVGADPTVWQCLVSWVRGIWPFSRR